MNKINKKNNKRKKGISLKKKILLIMFLFAFIALFVTSLIKYQDLKQSESLNNVCSVANSSCSSVQDGEYGIIFGLKVVDFGLAAFSLLLFLIIWQIFWPIKGVEIIVRIGAIMAGFIGAYFISLQIFTIHQYCIYCLVVDVSSIILSGLAVYYSSLAGK
ncbi:MAG: vitamin K epoxide reductase family protein [Candidatus Nanoarchaeia archaeon]